MSNQLETSRLLLIPWSPESLKKAMESDAHLAEYLQLAVADGWTEFGAAPLAYVLEMLESAPSSAKWLAYYPLHKQDNMLIGNGGYKGNPTTEGVVEIGYEIAPAYRNQGLATEFAQALVVNALSADEVKMVIAHTLGEANASTKVLAKCGFVKTAEINDPDDGLIWRWELKRT
jgi:ribosomal-protein-alanine N-acetyltransferase